MLVDLLGSTQFFIHCLLLLFPFILMAFFGMCSVYKGLFVLDIIISIPYLCM